MLPRKRPLIFTSMTEKKKKLLMDNVMKEERRCSECWSWKEVRGEVAKYLGCWYRHPRWHPVFQPTISLLSSFLCYLFLVFFLSFSLTFCFSREYVSSCFSLWYVISRITTPFRYFCLSYGNCMRIVLYDICEWCRFPKGEITRVI